MSERGEAVAGESEHGAVGQKVEGGAGEGDEHCCRIGCEEGLGVIVDALIFELYECLENENCRAEDSVELIDELQPGGTGEIAAQAAESGIEMAGNGGENGVSCVLRH